LEGVHEASLKIPWCVDFVQQFDATKRKVALHETAFGGNILTHQHGDNAFDRYWSGKINICNSIDAQIETQFRCDARHAIGVIFKRPKDYQEREW